MINKSMFLPIKNIYRSPFVPVFSMLSEENSLFLSQKFALEIIFQSELNIDEISTFSWAINYTDNALFHFFSEKLANDIGIKNSSNSTILADTNNIIKELNNIQLNYFQKQLNNYSVLGCIDKYFNKKLNWYNKALSIKNMVQKSTLKNKYLGFDFYKNLEELTTVYDLINIKYFNNLLSSYSDNNEAKQVWKKSLDNNKNYRTTNKYKNNIRPIWASSCKNTFIDRDLQNLLEDINFIYKNEENHLQNDYLLYNNAILCDAMSGMIINNNEHDVCLGYYVSGNFNLFFKAESLETDIEHYLINFLQKNNLSFRDINIFEIEENNYKCYSLLKKIILKYTNIDNIHINYFGGSLATGFSLSVSLYSSLLRLFHTINELNNPYGLYIQLLNNGNFSLVLLANKGI